MSRWKFQVAALVPDAALAQDVVDLISTAELGAALTVLRRVRAWGHGRLSTSDALSLNAVLGELETEAQSWGAP